MTAIRLRRVYDPPEPEADGLRVLVDRLWPRGLAKAAAGVDEWPKAVAPSTQLRKWFHDGGSAGEFRQRYEAELAEPEAVAELDRLRGLVGAGPVTLLTAVKDPGSSHAAILAEHLSA
ncbi:hypothetical protein ADK53_33675 [Streptomyces sp. WM6373]|uniref:DUF488 domain-containing protein n=1 Tax=Streptomyces TaxID=1883 RepID=UPI0006AE1F9A|nr:MULTISPECIES: DUF488 family protein [unclassified Streptomyces]KOU28912.1 hypothetical protein ADK53_33675 [Streptomyces sp. WM6373]KOU58162.1 hypothetical protein ADK96_35260 [Streptomyces sp. IGB124]KOU70524.1 hypothetical protein ADK61_34110 [Streptomyces sp. XY66]KOU80519.1 hypothetical protein ADK93_32790 [Streptomyces sp. XY58]KOV01302.1 hypothetical protein ADK89_31895 [Streptomyces sp. XY37]